MTLQEAYDWILKNSEMIGCMYEETEIHELVIVPVNSDNVNEIAKRVCNGDAYDDLLAGAVDFTVIAILDTPYNI